MKTLPPQHSAQFSVQLEHINEICRVALMQVDSDEHANRNAPLRRDFEDHQVFLKADPARSEQVVMAR